MLQFLQSGSLNGLGQSLLNSVWQIGLLWLTYLLITGNQRRFSPANRHNLALLFSGAGTCWFLFTLLGLSQTVTVADIRLLLPFQLPFFTASPVWTVFSLLYLIILFGLLVRYLAGFYQLRLARQVGLQSTPARLQSFIDETASVMGIRKEVRVRLVEWTNTAQTLGFFKPLILLPVALVNRLSIEQVETILLHELNHIRRNDYLLHILMMVFRTIFFFNPFAYFFFRAVSRERELACDDAVIQWNYPVPVYAGALFALEKFRQRGADFSVAADGNHPGFLVQRIRRLTGSTGRRRPTFSPVLSLSLLAAFFVFLANSFSYFHSPDVYQALPAHESGQAPPLQTAILTKEVAVIPAAQADALVKIVAVSEKSPRSRVKHRLALTIDRHEPRKVSDVSVLMTMLPKDEEMVQRIQYADMAQVRDFSNESSTVQQAPAVIYLDRIPYVQKSSFSYSVTSDTLPDALLQNKLKAALALSKLAADQAQARINEEIRAKKQDVLELKRQAEKLSSEQAEQVKPLLEKMQKEMQDRQKEIQALQQQLVRQIVFI
ncbi:MAG TPA: M56 family metallopeptidase [Puia sp.]|nr:M56 family metallopeptidase [Puia sp.]